MQRFESAADQSEGREIRRWTMSGQAAFDPESYIFKTFYANFFVFWIFLVQTNGNWWTNRYEVVNIL